MRYSVIAILVAGVLASGAALAGAQSRQDDRTVLRVSELERRAEVVQRRINGPQKLGATERSELRQQQREIRRMIEQLEAGGAVDPQEMDRIQSR